MADKVDKYQIVLEVKDQATAPSAKVVAALKSVSDAEKLVADKAAQLNATKSARTAAADAEDTARAIARRTGRTGSVDDINAAAATLAQARAAAEQARQFQAAAEAEAAQAREAQKAANAELAAAQREEAAARAAVATEAAQKEAEATRAAMLHEQAVKQTSESIAALGRAEQQERDVIAGVTDRVAELKAARSGASEAEQAGIDAEIGELQKVIAAHEQEVVSIQKKQLALKETAEVEAATSEEEISHIRAAYDARRTAAAVSQARSRASAVGAAATETAAGEVGGIGKLLSDVNESGGNLAATIGGISAVAGLVEGVRKSLDLAKQNQEANDRLGVALDGDLRKFDDLNQKVQAIAKNSYFAQAQLKAAAESLLERGVPTDKIDQAVQVVADTAAALHEPLDQIAEQVAVTFGGTVPRQLGRAVPALKNLSAEALKSGAALQLLGDRFGGKALEEMATASGQEKKAVADIAQAWTDVGAAMLPIEQTILPKIAEGLKSFSDPFKPDAIYNWTDVLREAIAETLGDITGAGAFASSLFQRVVDTLVDGIKLAAAEGKVGAVDVLAFLLDHTRDTLRTIAGDIDTLTAKVPAFLGGKTNLAGYVDQKLSTNVVDGYAAEARTNAGAALSKFNGDSAENILGGAARRCQPG